jgi:hypothetical protein
MPANIADMKDALLTETASRPHGAKDRASYPAHLPWFISSGDRIHHINLLDRCKRGAQTPSMRVERYRSRPPKPAFFLTMVALALSSCGRNKSYGEDRETGAAKTTTLVVFAQRPMRDGQWSALFDALKQGAQKVAATTPALGTGVDLVRGDTMAPGLRADKVISVYLHGDCRLTPMPRYEPARALGWVYRVHGRIEPFIHVDCSQIVQQLGPLALGMKSNRLETLMGEAVARVIMHEWVHVATQNAGHAKEGVGKSSFGIADLLAADDAIWRDPRFAHKKRPEL